jgi:hypothetical protein
LGRARLPKWKLLLEAWSMHGLYRLPADFSDLKTDIVVRKFVNPETGW